MDRVERGLKAFISYSHADEPLRDEFVRYLKVLEREQLIVAWHDRKIMPGNEWASDIDEELNSSNLILLLISADFIASRYAYDIEMKRALEFHDMKRARVVPILLRATPLSGALPFERLQMIPDDRRPVTSWADRDAAWSLVTEKLRQVATAVLASPEVPLKARRVLLESQSTSNQIICVFDNSAVIGRSPVVDIPLIHAPLEIGKQHARFFFDADKRSFLIDDLDTRNGTFIDGRQVRMKPLALGSRVDLAGKMSFTFWRYGNEESTAGALVYSNHGQEVGRYVLAPFGKVGIGTRTADAVQVPLLSDGRSVGVLESSDGLLYYTPDKTGERIRLTDQSTIDAKALSLSVKILQ